MLWSVDNCNAINFVPGAANSEPLFPWSWVAEKCSPTIDILVQRTAFYYCHHVNHTRNISWYRNINFMRQNVLCKGDESYKFVRQNSLLIFVTWSKRFYHLSTNCFPRFCKTCYLKQKTYLLCNKSTISTCKLEMHLT